MPSLLIDSRYSIRKSTFSPPCAFLIAAAAVAADVSLPTLAVIVAVAAAAIAATATYDSRSRSIVSVGTSSADSHRRRGGSRAACMMGTISAVPQSTMLEDGPSLAKRSESQGRRGLQRALHQLHLNLRQPPQQRRPRRLPRHLVRPPQPLLAREIQHQERIPDWVRKGEARAHQSRRPVKIHLSQPLVHAPLALNAVKNGLRRVLVPRVLDAQTHARHVREAHAKDVIFVSAVGALKSGVAPAPGAVQDGRNSLDDGLGGEVLLVQEEHVSIWESRGELTFQKLVRNFGVQFWRDFPGVPVPFTKGLEKSEVCWPQRLCNQAR
ncbi:hypothetical protein BM221_005935 [Beauveria bassiana]|uniref:Uncharacterized protein n=1 Tax=Beauveria bassiana TaxID=176275 RepID=A0A2N6NKG3_BEABA|nr:hypothetical protein BM221_005935 [Beauveria bassiana]